MPKFAKTVYIKWADPGDGSEPWMKATTDPATFAEAGERLRVGVYVLKEQAEISADISVKVRRA